MKGITISGNSKVRRNNSTWFYRTSARDLVKLTSTKRWRSAGIRATCHPAEFARKSSTSNTGFNSTIRFEFAIFGTLDYFERATHSDRPYTDKYTFTRDKRRDWHTYWLSLRSWLTSFNLTSFLGLFFTNPSVLRFFKFHRWQKLFFHCPSGKSTVLSSVFCRFPVCLQDSEHFLRSLWLCMRRQPQSSGRTHWSNKNKD